MTIRHQSAARSARCATSQAEVHQLEQLTLHNLHERLAEHGMREALGSSSLQVHCLDCPTSFGVDVLRGARHAMRRHHVVESKTTGSMLTGELFAVRDVLERRQG